MPLERARDDARPSTCCGDGVEPRLRARRAPRAPPAISSGRDPRLTGARATPVPAASAACATSRRTRASSRAFAATEPASRAAPAEALEVLLARRQVGLALRRRRRARRAMSSTRLPASSSVELRLAPASRSATAARRSSARSTVSSAASDVRRARPRSPSSTARRCERARRPWWRRGPRSPRSGRRRCTPWRRRARILRDRRGAATRARADGRGADQRVLPCGSWWGAGARRPGRAARISVTKRANGSGRDRSSGSPTSVRAARARRAETKKKFSVASDEQVDEERRHAGETRRRDAALDRRDDRRAVRGESAEVLVLEVAPAVQHLAQDEARDRRARDSTARRPRARIARDCRLARAGDRARPRRAGAPRLSMCSSTSLR